MEGDYDYDVEDYDDDWMYVEDHVALSDELAETQIASPGYSGSNYELADDGAYDIHLMDYWDDLEYAPDAYWDYGAKVELKRKSLADHGSTTSAKRIKVSSEYQERFSSPVIFRSQNERIRLAFLAPPKPKTRSSYSLLPDWRKRFAHRTGIVMHKKMPVDMQRAAEAQDEGFSLALTDRTHITHAEEEVGEEAEGSEDDLPTVDPDMLKAILKQRLGEAGLDGMSESAFMQTIGKMLSAEGDVDEVAGELASSVLDKITSAEGDNALSGWLTQQGVSMDAGDDASSVATCDVPGNPEQASAGARISQSSPRDSAISLQEYSPPGQKSSPLDMPTAPINSKKRPMPAELNSVNKKSKKVAFAVPIPPSSEDTKPGLEEADAESQTRNDKSPDREAQPVSVPARTVATDHVDETAQADGKSKRKRTSTPELTEQGFGKKRSKKDAPQVQTEGSTRQTRSSTRARKG